MPDSSAPFDPTDAQQAEVDPPEGAPVPKRGIAESVLVTRGLLLVGVALLLFGTAYALKISFGYDLIGPPARVALGFIAGIGLAFAGWRLRESTYRYPR
jgi:uncharacterized membrane protein